MESNGESLGHELANTLALCSQAAEKGFCYTSDSALRDKLSEEFYELSAALIPGPSENRESEICEELCDVLIMLMRIIQHYDLDATQLLHDANERFRARLNNMCELAVQFGIRLESLGDAEKDLWWRFAKRALQKGYNNGQA